MMRLKVMHEKLSSLRGKLWNFLDKEVWEILGKDHASELVTEDFTTKKIMVSMDLLGGSLSTSWASLSCFAAYFYMDSKESGSSVKILSKAAAASYAISLAGKFAMEWELSEECLYTSACETALGFAPALAGIVASRILGSVIDNAKEVSSDSQPLSKNGEQGLAR
jgi:hypothetical protein